MAIKKSKEAAVSEPAFSKEQLLQASRFVGRRDVLTALLNDERTYTVAEAEQLVVDYMKGKVK